MNKRKILAEMICKEATEKKLTLYDIMAALNIVFDKYYADATI